MIFNTHLKMSKWVKITYILNMCNFYVGLGAKLATIALSKLERAWFKACLQAVLNVTLFISVEY